MRGYAQCRRPKFPSCCSLVIAPALLFRLNLNICHLAALKLLSNWLKAPRVVTGNSICHKRAMAAVGG